MCVCVCVCVCVCLKRSVIRHFVLGIVLHYKIVEVI